jgi:parallel beta-helix repeat protein
LVVAVLAFAWLYPGQALATHVSCGDTITQDTTLDSDLACGASGLRIAVDGVSLDLGGHTVEGYVRTVLLGDWEEWPHYELTNITIENGNVIGEVRVGSDYSFVRDLRISGRGLVMMKDRESKKGVRESVGNVVERVGVSESFRGIYLEGQTDFILRRSTSSTGIRAFVVFNGEISRNLAGEIALSGFSRDNTIKSNLISGSVASGISLRTASRNLVSRNRIEGGQVGISVLGSAPICSVTFGGASFDNSIVHNSVTGAAQDGIFIQGPTEGICDEGLFPTAARTNVVGNKSSRNGDDGIDVEEPSTTLTRNRANRNGDLGIEAVAGTIDGGGNRAFGNGNPLQCLNVRCK